MAQLVADCPRCGSHKMTFDLTKATVVNVIGGWQTFLEAFCTCRHCHHNTIFVLQGTNYNLRHFFSTGDELVKQPGSANDFVQINGFVSLKDVSAEFPPDHLPENIRAVFTEAATCKAVLCHNAAATMFRLCLDLATREKLPPLVKGEEPTPNYRTRRDLGLRLPWLFDTGRLPGDLRELSHAVKEDGNDGAHAGTITAADVEDLLDFTKTLLERLYTDPARVQMAKERRDARRAVS